MGSPPSFKNIKYTVECAIFKKKNSKIFSPEEPLENFSPGPAVALNRPGCELPVKNQENEISYGDLEAAARMDGEAVASDDSARGVTT